MLIEKSLSGDQESFHIVEKFLLYNDSGNSEYSEAILLTLKEIKEQVIVSGYSRLYIILLKTKWMHSQFEFAELRSIYGSLVSEKHRQQSLLTAKAYGLIYSNLNELNKSKYWKDEND